MAQAEPGLTAAEIPTAIARSVPVTVVAVKWPGHWIIRAMRCFSNVEVVADMVRPYVAAMPQDELEWTQHTYRFPGYLVYGSGDLLGLNSRERDYNWPVPPNGAVYLFGWTRADVYREPARRLDA